MRVTGLKVQDLRFPMPGGVADAVHTDPQFSMAAVTVETDGDVTGAGFATTLGRGNELVAAAVRSLEPHIVGTDVDQAVATLGATTARWSNESQLRWVGPHKGVIHLALAAITVGLVDLWAKKEGRPLWRLLLSLEPEQVVDLVDFRPIADYLSREEALDILRSRRLPDTAIDDLARHGYPAYNTSVGWLGHDLEAMVALVREAAADGYGAVKLKVGSPDLAADVSRVFTVRSAVGDDIDIMIDANQYWGVEDAITAGRALSEADIFWFEEPIHPDDVMGYRAVSDALAPMRIAGGEHCANPVLFKNFIAAGALQVVQPDVVRLAGVSEYLAVALMAAKAGLPAVPHVGDVGQVHQHLISFTTVAMGLPRWRLEMIPHLAEHFAEPCTIERGHYRLPETPGASTTLTEAARRHTG